MLSTMIQTVEAGTGKPQSIPADLLAKVQRADGILKTLLDKVGQKFDIKARWWFDSGARNEFDVMLSLSTAERGTCYPFPENDLRDDETIQNRLWTPIGFLIPYLDEQVDRNFENVRRGLEALAATSED